MTNQKTSKGWEKEKLNDKGLNKVEIVVDMSGKPYKTMIGSNYSAWDSLFVLLEGLAVLARLSEKEGYSIQTIIRKVKNQLKGALKDYERTWSEKSN